MTRLEMQIEAYAKEKGIPTKLFNILDIQKDELVQLKGHKGSIVSPGDM